MVTTNMQTRNLRRYGLLLISYLLAITLANTGYAQGVVIEEIVVTAQKREENIQDVPSSVAAFSGLQLEKQRITTAQDLSTIVPTFNINSTSHQRATPAMRGSSSNNTTPGGDQSVALFIDEIYYGGSMDWNPDLFDVERLEVLRGPQGTLFGRNVVGGAINIVTKDPSDEFEGSLRATVGNFDRIEFDGYVAGPVADNLFASVAASSKNADGFLRNTFTGEGAESVDKQSIRGKLLYRPSDSFEWNVSLSYSLDDSGGPTRDYMGPPITAVPELADFVPDDNENTTASPFDGGIDAEYLTVTSKLTWGITDWADVVSVTGYRSMEAQLGRVDQVGVPYPGAVDYDPFNDVEQISQELRLVSTALDRWDFTLGLYYFFQDNFEYEPITFTFFPGTFFHFLQQIYLSLTPSLPGTPGISTVTAERDMQMDTESFAVFGQVSYALTDQLNVTLGGRWTKDKKEGYGASFGDPNLIFSVYPRTEISESWDAFTPKASVDFRFNDDLMTYATVSRGFKSGSFNHGIGVFADLATTIARGAATLAVPLDPEYVWSYEAGFKSELLDDRALLNASFYYSKYDGAQNAFVLPTGAATTVNIEDMEIYGIEVDGLMLFTDNFNIGFNYAFSDSEVGKDDPAFGGNRAALTPKHAGAVWASYSQPLNGGGMLSISGDISFKSNYFTEISNDPAFKTNNDGILNGRIEYQTSDERWTLSVWGKNLTDERYILYSNDLGGFWFAAGDPNSALAFSPRWSQRRHWGVSLQVDF